MWLRPIEYIISLTILLLGLTAIGGPVDRKNTTFVMDVWVERDLGISHRLELRHYRKEGRTVYQLFSSGGASLEIIQLSTVNQLKKISAWKKRKTIPYIKRAGGGFQRAQFAMPALRITGTSREVRAAFEVYGVKASLRTPLRKSLERDFITTNVTWKKRTAFTAEYPSVRKTRLKFIAKDPPIKKGSEYFLTLGEPDAPIVVKIVRFVDKDKKIALVTSGIKLNEVWGYHAHAFTVPIALLQHTGPKALKAHKEGIAKQHDPEHQGALRVYEPSPCCEAEVVKLGKNKTKQMNERLNSIANVLWALKNDLAEFPKHIDRLRQLDALHNIPDHTFVRLALSEHAPQSKNAWLAILKTLSKTKWSGWALAKFLLDRRLIVTKQYRVLATLFEAALELESERVGVKAAKKEGKSVIKERRDQIAPLMNFREQLQYEALINKVAPSWLRSFFLSCARRSAS